MRRGPRSNAFRLGRAKKIGGIPLNRKTLEDLGKAAKDIMRMSHSSDEERNFRVLACSTCEHKRGARCDLCGCFINYKAKLKSSTCPIGRWSGFVPEASIDNSSEEDTSEENSH